MKGKLNKKIMLSGGGTGGSVIPLIFIFRELQNEFDFLFVGTYSGLEKEIIKKEGIKYFPILSGKWRRYFSLKNIVDLFKIFLAFWQSLCLLIKEKPSLLISAGGFVAVPLSLAAWFLKIPIIIHQQDVLPGLANKLMAPLAKIITLTFEKSLKNYGKSAKLIGNIGFEDKLDSIDKKQVFDKYNFDNNLPLVLVLGGGTGSLFINNLLGASLDCLLDKVNIFHVSGKSDRDINSNFSHKRYIKFNFIDHNDLMLVMKVSDLVVSRCGLSTLSEISFLKKASLLIPMPNSHQEENAKEFEDREGAIVLKENFLSPSIFCEKIINTLENSKLLNDLQNKSSLIIKNGNQEMIAIIKEILV